MFFGARHLHPERSYAGGRDDLRLWIGDSLLRGGNGVCTGEARSLARGLHLVALIDRALRILRADRGANSPDASDMEIARVDDLIEAVGDESSCGRAEKPTAQPSRLCSERAE